MDLTEDQADWIRRIKQKAEIDRARARSEKKAVGEGYAEAAKESVKEEEKMDQKVDALVGRSVLLLKISAVFPFDFFPDEIAVDLNKVNVVRRDLLMRKVHCIFVKDILDVLVTEGIFFSSLTIIDVGINKENSITVNYLDKEDAKEARKIIQGLIVITRQDVDLSKVAKNDFRRKVESLGQVSGID